MLATDYKIGEKFKNKELGFVLEVVEYEGGQMFEDQDRGDLYEWVDEDLYKQIF